MAIMINPIPVSIGGIIFPKIPKIIIAIAVRMSSATSVFFMVNNFMGFIYTQI
jgi:hypothetical protein